MHGHSPLTLITAAIGGFFASSTLAPIPDLAFITQIAGIDALLGTLAVLLRRQPPPPPAARRRQPTLVDRRPLHDARSGGRDPRRRRREGPRRSVKSARR